MIQQLSDSEIISRINESTKLTFGQDYLDEIAYIISDLTHADYTFITKIKHWENKAIPLVSLKRGVKIENINYALENTPCTTVTQTCVGFYPNNVQQLFPKDHYLRELDIEGYIGVAIVPKSDEPPIGIVTCLYASTSEYSPQYLKIIELIAAIVQTRIEKEVLIRENHLIIQENKDQAKELRYSNALLKEIHHRLKNNLHIISGILKLQALESKNSEVENQLNEAVERVRAMALVHEKIYGADKLYEISLVDYIRDLIQSIIATTSPGLEIILNVTSDVSLLRPDPLASLAMIINELTMNAIKYGFRNRDNGEIEVSIYLSGSGDDVILKFMDDGEWLESHRSDNLGTSLIEIFTEQLRGTMERDNRYGTIYYFTFPKEKIVMEA